MTAPRRLRGGLGRQAFAFGLVGVASTAAYALLFLALRTTTAAVAANAVALVVTAVGNTAANRRFTFGIREGGSMLRDQLGGLVALAVALVITTATVNALGAIAPHAPRLAELAVLVAANAMATVARFVVLRAWITRDRRSVPYPAHAAARIHH